MTNKQFNVRQIQKHDTEANWDLTNGFIPFDGELIVYDKDATHDKPRIKIGDGVTDVKNLPFSGEGTPPVIEMKRLFADESQRANALRCITERNAGHVVIYETEGKVFVLNRALILEEQLYVSFSVFIYTQRGKDFTNTSLIYNNETDRFDYVIVEGALLPSAYGTSDAGKILGTALIDGNTVASWVRLYPPYPVHIEFYARITGAVNKAIQLFATRQGDAFYETWSDSDKDMEGLITRISTKNEYTQRYDPVMLGGIEGSVLSASSDTYSNSALLEFAAFDSSTNLIGKMLMRLSSDNSAGEGNETATIYIRIDASIAQPFPQT